MDHVVYQGAHGMELELAHMSDEEVLNKLGLFSQEKNEERPGDSLQIHKHVFERKAIVLPVHSSQGKQQWAQAARKPSELHAR